MPRRARGAEGRAPLDPLLHRADRHARGRQGGVPAVPAHHGVGVQRAAATLRDALERVEIHRRVDALQLITRRGPALHPLDRARQVRRAQGGEDRLDSLGALGMAGSRVVQASSRMEDDRNGH